MSRVPRALMTSVALGTGWADCTPDDIAASAARADAAGFDMLVLGGGGPGLDPLILAAWLASNLRQAAPVVVLPALHSAPYHVARALSALDFMTRGRSGWAPSTLQASAQACAIGPAANVPADQVCSRGLDFIAATCSLWDSWDVDALVIDKAGGLYLRPDGMRRVDYRGPYFQVMGPLNAARPPQGYPVLVQSDSDPLHQVTIARADVLLITTPDAERLQARRTEVESADGHARLLASLEPGGEEDTAELAAQLARWSAEGLIDGVHFTCASPAELECLTEGVLAHLRTLGLIAPTPEAGTLRSRLGRPPLSRGLAVG